MKNKKPKIRDKLVNYKKYFPWFKNNKNLIYFDNAATTLKPIKMIEKVDLFNKKYSYLQDNNYLISKKINYEIKNTRRYLGKFLQANINEVFFTSGATESLNLIADLLQDFLNKNDEIIIHYLEHGSNLLPWFKLRDRKGIKINFVGKNIMDINENIFAEKISKNTKIITFTSASNLLGNNVDVRSIISKIKRINPNILFIVDATQQLEHFPALCHETNCDFLVGSAHKLIGPTGLGFMYIKKEIQDTIFKKIDLKKYIEFNKLNLCAIFSFSESLKMLLNISYKKMNERERILKKYFLDHVDMSKIEIYNKDVNSPLITFNIYNKNKRIIDGQDIEFYLGQNGVLSRSSLSCAKLAKYSLCTHNVVRISLFFYNDLKDIKKLVNLINDFREGDELNGLI